MCAYPPGSNEPPSDGPFQGPFSHDFTHQPVAARVPEKVAKGAFSTGTLILQTGDEFIIDFVSTLTQPHQLAARVVMTARCLSQFVSAFQSNIVRFEEQFGRIAPEPPMPTQSDQGDTPYAKESSDFSEMASEDEESDAAARGGHSESPAAQPYLPPGFSVHDTTYSHDPTGPFEPGGRSNADSPSFQDIYDQLKITDEQLAGSFANTVIIRHTPYEFCFEFIVNFFPKSIVTNRVFMAAGRAPFFFNTINLALQRYQNRPKDF